MKTFFFIIFSMCRSIEIPYRAIKWLWIKNKCPMCGNENFEIMFDRLVSEVPNPDIKNNIHNSDINLDFIVCYNCHKSFCLDKDLL